MKEKDKDKGEDDGENEENAKKDESRKEGKKTQKGCESPVILKHFNQNIKSGIRLMKTCEFFVILFFSSSIHTNSWHFYLV